MFAGGTVEVKINANGAKNVQTVKDGTMNQRGSGTSQQQNQSEGSNCIQENESDETVQQQNKSRGDNVLQRNISGESVAQTKQKQEGLGGSQEREGLVLFIITPQHHYYMYLHGAKYTLSIKKVSPLKILQQHV